jgi:hypothetical protein
MCDKSVFIKKRSSFKNELFASVALIIIMAFTSCLSPSYKYYSKVIQLTQSDPLHDSSYFLHVTVQHLDSKMAFLIPSKDFPDALKVRKDSSGDRILVDIPKELAKQGGSFTVDSAEFEFFRKYYLISDSLLNPTVREMPTQEILANYFDRDLKLFDTIPLSICYSVVYTLAERKEYIYFTGMQTGLPVGWNVSPCVIPFLPEKTDMHFLDYYQEYDKQILVALSQYIFPPCECEAIQIVYGKGIRDFYYIRSRILQRIVYR